MSRPDRPAAAENVMRKLRHDMRTPLGQILGYGEMLEEELEDRGQEDLLPDLVRIRTAARALLELVDETFQSDGGGTSESLPSGGGPDASGDERQVRSEGRVLVVDDDEQNRDLLVRRLSGAGHEVTAVADGRRALMLIEEREFDVVILDVLMPGMSGLEVLEAVRANHAPEELPIIMATALDASDDVIRALQQGANDYLSKPIDMAIALARIDTQLGLRAATLESTVLAQQLEIHNAFMRKTFGRYVSEEIVTNLLDSREGLELRGEKRTLSILMADLRGFSTLTESLLPMEVVSLLNNYLGEMAEVIHRWHGTIDEFLGDGILAFFGAPVAGEDDAERAVACAIEMQRAVDRVNASNRERDLPEIEMGIGISTGDVIVGNLGSEKRTKYGAVGSSVNLAGRIESYTLGGEILICDATRALLGEVEVDRIREVHPKGFEEPIQVHRIVSLGTELRVPDGEEHFASLLDEIPVVLALMEGKSASAERFDATIHARSARGIQLRCDRQLPELGDLRIEAGDDASACYAKVVDVEAPSYTLRFSTRSASLDRLLDQG